MDEINTSIIKGDKFLSFSNYSYSLPGGSRYRKSISDVLIQNFSFVVDDETYHFNSNIPHWVNWGDKFYFTYINILTPGGWIRRQIIKMIHIKSGEFFLARECPIGKEKFD